MTMKIDRRLVLASALSFAAVAPLRAATLVPTPRQGAGPYYPQDLPLDADNDLIQVVGHPETAEGDILHLFGRVLAADGTPVADARVEIWQCDANGVYHHPRDRRADRADPAFQGFGHTATATDGGYRFRTIVPVPYPGRTPHIHVLVRAPGRREFVTQMYLRGHPMNARDGLFRSLGREAQARASVLLRPAPELDAGAQAADFDVVLGRIRS